MKSNRKRHHNDERSTDIKVKKFTKEGEEIEGAALVSRKSRLGCLSDQHIDMRT
jgi:hypothetical protein